MVDCSGLENLAGNPAKTAEMADFCGSQAAQDAPFTERSAAQDGNKVGTETLADTGDWLENARREAQRYDRRGTIYFVGYANGPIKIGFTSNLDYRIESLQTACPYDLVVLATVEGTMGLEAELHARFRSHRLRGEWFARHPEILAEIARQQTAQCGTLSSQCQTHRETPHGRDH